MPFEVYKQLQPLMMFRSPMGCPCKLSPQDPHEGKYSSHQIDEKANPDLQEETTKLVQCLILQQGRMFIGNQYHESENTLLPRV